MRMQGIFKKFGQAFSGKNVFLALEFDYVELPGTETAISYPLVFAPEDHGVGHLAAVGGEDPVGAPVAGHRHLAVPHEDGLPVRQEVDGGHRGHGLAAAAAEIIQVSQLNVVLA